jgi:hypothetical protein
MSSFMRAFSILWLYPVKVIKFAISPQHVQSVLAALFTAIYRCCYHIGMTTRLCTFLLVLLASPPTFALDASAPPGVTAVTADPAPDPAHPATMTVLHIPSHGVRINGLLYSAAGVPPHPTSGAQPREREVALMADNMETLQGVTAKSMADEMIAHAKAYSIATTAGGLTKTPLLVLTSDDGLALPVDALVKDIEANGNTTVTAMHVATDHAWSDHRIALQSAIVLWLSRLPP